MKTVTVRGRVEAGRDRVRCFMRDLGLAGAVRSKKAYTAGAADVVERSENLGAREFRAPAPNRFMGR